jgi:integrase-like protein
VLSIDHPSVVVILGERSESKGLSSGPHQIALEDLVSLMNCLRSTCLCLLIGFHLPKRTCAFSRFYFSDFRFTGMRVSDVVGLTAERFDGNRLFLYTQKTGVPVHIVIPEFVLRVLESTPRKSENHFFWSGVGKLESIVRSWQTRLRRLFQLASVPNGHAHRFRDLFAVELLLAGIPIERVSILLGHQSTRVTERHYNPWVRARQEQLEADLERAWSRDPLVLVEAKVTRRLRGERERVN